MTMRNDFAVIIPTHGRADRVYTYHALKRSGYSGKVYMLCDDKDKNLEEYKKEYGEENVLIFSKEEYEGKFDKMDNFGKTNVVVYARNAIYDAARSVGLRYIAVLDDDYTSFEYRVDGEYNYKFSAIRNLDDVFIAFLEFLITTRVKTICWSQGGDFIGGSKNMDMAIKKTPKRKAMNLFFFDVENPMEFMGTINEDLTASVAEGLSGQVVLTTPLVSLNQKQTQANAGGLTDIYLDLGTYVKSFYSVMRAPSAVKISMMGNKYKRIHHAVTWNNCAPKILRETV